MGNATDVVKELTYAAVDVIHCHDTGQTPDSNSDWHVALATAEPDSNRFKRRVVACQAAFPSNLMKEAES